MVRRVAVLGVVAAMMLGCRGAPRAVAQSAEEQQVARLVDSLMPAVSAAAGLRFKSVPKSAVRTRAQIRAYLIAKMDRELPPERLAGIGDVFRLLDMLPDSVDLRQLFIDLYTEQIAGFFDPDSTTLFTLTGADPAQLRLVLAHEMVHALQDQYTPVDSILHDTTDADRLTAAQAVLEGQATLASLEVMFPAADILDNDEYWANFKAILRQQQFSGSVFGRAPMVVRESLVFPYVGGTDFVRWFDQTFPGKVPFGARMPLSTEEILHHNRYARGDTPLAVRFTGDTAGVFFEDTFGEYDIDILRASLAGSANVSSDTALGWGGDRLRVYHAAAGPALVWVTVWDTPADAGPFATTVAGPLARHPRAGYRIAVDSLHPAGRLATRVVVAPVGWEGWTRLPGVTVGGSR